MLLKLRCRFGRFLSLYNHADQYIIITVIYIPDKFACNTNKSDNIAHFNYYQFTHNQKAHLADDFTFIGESGGLLNVTGSHER